MKIFYNLCLKFQVMILKPFYKNIDNHLVLFNKPICIFIYINMEYYKKYRKTILNRSRCVRISLLWFFKHMVLKETRFITKTYFLKCAI